LVDSAKAAKDYDIDTTPAPSYESKIQLYQLAVLLMAILCVEKDIPQYLAVRIAIEEGYFSLSSDPTGARSEQVKFAMIELNELIVRVENAGKSLEWAQNWFREIGVNVSNPASLALFSMHWIDLCIAEVKSLTRFIPV
jgi:hypothetical protein